MLPPGCAHIVLDNDGTDTAVSLSGSCAALETAMLTALDEMLHDGVVSMHAFRGFVLTWGPELCGY